MFVRLILLSCFMFAFAAPVALADENPKPDDTVAFDLSSEDWVMTKTARVILDVEASVSGANAGTMRADMTKAVNDAAKGDWRLVNFSRSQDQTGLERWSVNFEARLPENELGGLGDAAKKASKAGMQITVGDINFAPTLDETEATRASLRTKILKQVTDQLTSLNTTMPGRTYRVAQIVFEADTDTGVQPVLRPRMMMAAAAIAQEPPGAALQRSQKIVLTAHVTFAALSPLATASTH